MSSCVVVAVIALGDLPPFEVPFVRKTLDILAIVKQTATLKTLALIISAAGMGSELQSSSDESMCTLLAPSDSALSAMAPAEFARLMGAGRVVVIVGHGNPALGALAGNVGVASLPLGIDGVEFLIQPFVR